MLPPLRLLPLLLPLASALALTPRQLPDGCTQVSSDTINCPPGVTPPGHCHEHGVGEWHCDEDHGDEEEDAHNSTMMTMTVSMTSSSAMAATTSSSAAAVTTTAVVVVDEDEEHGDGEDEEHGDATGSGVAGPSPTESVGCVLHGDHWDCDAPASATQAPSTSATTGGNVTVPTNLPEDSDGAGSALGIMTGGMVAAMLGAVAWVL